MTEEMTELSLETLGRGGAMELFNRELGRVLENISDVNTDPKATRSVSIELTIKPGEDRESGAVKVVVKAKFAPPRPLASVMYIGEKDGKAVAVTYDPKQTDLLRENQVLPIGRKGA